MQYSGYIDTHCIEGSHKVFFSDPHGYFCLNTQSKRDTSVMDFRFEDLVNPLTPVSDQGRIPPYIIDQTGDENKEKYEVGEVPVDPVSNSQN